MPDNLPSFSSFKVRQAILEIRYPESFLLWDRAGFLATGASSLFRSLKSTSAAPNHIAFTADDRFIMSIETTKVSITDFSPDMRSDHDKEISTFIDFVISNLEIGEITRAGARFISTYTVKNMEVGKSYLRSTWDLPDNLFGLKEAKSWPSLKVEGSDGTVGYTASVFARETQFDFAPSPEYNFTAIAKQSDKISEVVYDVDFYSAVAIPRESFKAAEWYRRWSRVLRQESDRFLKLVQHAG